MISPQAKVILKAIDEHSGSDMVDVSRRVGVAPYSVCAYVANLTRSGLTSTRLGRYYLTVAGRDLVKTFKGAKPAKPAKPKKQVSQASPTPSPSASAWSDSADVETVEQRLAQLELAVAKLNRVCKL